MDAVSRAIQKITGRTYDAELVLMEYTAEESAGGHVHREWQVQSQGVCIATVDYAQMKAAVAMWR